ncbi:hypothetical protein ABZY05_04985 [Streptomyces canus]|uniref:hypothetical protein n=1 Tax=Streptomyces canus TaxID=58343 RepID=UPI0033BA41E8
MVPGVFSHWPHETETVFVAFVAPQNSIAAPRCAPISSVSSPVLELAGFGTAEAMAGEDHANIAADSRPASNAFRPLATFRIT